MSIIVQGTVQMPPVDIRRASERFHTKIDWLDSYHSFSFANHYDPANTHHGLLLVSNDDRVQAGSGFIRLPCEYGLMWQCCRNTSPSSTEA